MNSNINSNFEIKNNKLIWKNIDTIIPDVKVLSVNQAITNYAKIKHIEKIYINDINNLDVEKINLNNLTNLRSIVVANCPLISNLFFRVANHKILEKIKIINCSVTPDMFLYSENINKFSIVNCQSVNSKIVKHFKNFKNFKKLNINNCALIDNDISKYLKNLEELKISKCAQISSYMFIKLHKLKKLKLIDLTQKDINDGIFDYLDNLTNFKSFNCAELHYDIAILKIPKCKIIFKNSTDENKCGKIISIFTITQNQP